MQEVDFSEPEVRRKEINDWVKDITKGNILDLIPQNSIFPDTTAVLVNAAYFKGFWDTKFDKEQTQVKTFNGATPADVKMMAIKDRFNYGSLN